MTATTDADRAAWIRRVEAFYDAELRAKLEPAENGKHIVIDGESLDYEVDANPIVASVHLRDRRPNGRMLSFDIGFDSVTRGGPWPGDSDDGTSAGAVNGHRDQKSGTPWVVERSFASLQAEEYYNAELRAKLEPEHKGKYILIDPASRDYEVDSDPIAAAVHLRDRQPNGEWIIFCIGYDIHQCVFHGLRFHL